MLKLSLDEGFVFDVLSIHQIKSQSADSETKKAIAASAYRKLVLELAEQLGSNKLRMILMSEEYEVLLAANRLTFDLVEKARNATSGLAKEVDDANMNRYNAKVALQATFFGSEPTEIKTQAS